MWSFEFALTPAEMALIVPALRFWRSAGAKSIQTIPGIPEEIQSLVRLELESELDGLLTDN